MGDFKLQYESKIEKCICCWDEVNKTWIKVYKTNELPADVVEQIQKEKERATLLLEAEKYKEA